MEITGETEGRDWAKRKEKNGDRVFDIEIGKMSKSDMIKYCRDEWIIIPAETMKRLRKKEER